MDYTESIIDLVFTKQMDKTSSERSNFDQDMGFYDLLLEEVITYDKIIEYIDLNKLLKIKGGDYLDSVVGNTYFKCLDPKEQIKIINLLYDAGSRYSNNLYAEVFWLPIETREWIKINVPRDSVRFIELAYE